MSKSYPGRKSPNGRMGSERIKNRKVKISKSRDRFVTKRKTHRKETYVLSKVKVVEAKSGQKVFS